MRSREKKNRFHLSPFYIFHSTEFRNRLLVFSNLLLTNFAISFSFALYNISIAHNGKSGIHVYIHKQNRKIPAFIFAFMLWLLLLIFSCAILRWYPCVECIRLSVIWVNRWHVNYAFHNQNSSETVLAHKSPINEHNFNISHSFQCFFFARIVSINSFSFIVSPHHSSPRPSPIRIFL